MIEGTSTPMDHLNKQVQFAVKMVIDRRQPHTQRLVMSH